MKLYPSKPQAFSHLISQSIKKYSLTFKVIFPLFVLMAIIKQISIYTNGIVAQLGWYLNTVFVFVEMLLQLSVCSVAWYTVHMVFNGSPLPLWKVFRKIYHRLLLIYLAFFIFIVIVGFIIFGGEYLFNHFLESLSPLKEWKDALLELSLIGGPVLIFVVLFFPVFPWLAIDDLTLWQGIRRSIQWVGYQNGWRAFVLYVAYWIALFGLLPSTLHSQWLSKHYLDFFFDVFFLSIIGPVLINFTVLLLNDLKLRNRSGKLSSKVP